MRAYGSEDRVSWCGCCGGGKSQAGIKKCKKIRHPGKARARQKNRREIKRELEQ